MKLSRLITVILCFVLTSAIWAAQTSPLPMLEGIANQILTTLKQNKSQLKGNPQIIYRTVNRYLLPHVDLPGMARSVLGRQVWNTATSNQKNQFMQAFTDLVVKTYANPLTEYNDEVIKFLPARGTESRFIKVSSIIKRSNGNNIPLVYSLVDINGQWKIYDLSVEGVSLLQSFRSQFSQALNNSDIQSLISQMQRQAKAAPK